MEERKPDEPERRGKEVYTSRFSFKVPAVQLKKPAQRWGRPSDLQAYEQDLINHAKFRQKPTMIADILQRQYNLDPSFMTAEKVERRLRYLKQNKLATLPPTNGDISLLALDKRSTCKIFYFHKAIDFYFRARGCKLSCPQSE